MRALEQASQPSTDRSERRGLDPAFVVVKAFGQMCLVTLLAVSPVVNPALAQAGDERIYLAHALAVLAITASGVVWIQRRKPLWILATWGLGAAYVVTVGLARGHTEIGVFGNVYRPLQPVLIFCACAILCVGVRDAFLRVALFGGIAGCGLAVLNTFVPAIDPFMAPELPWKSTYGTLEREAGAFVYPNNLGMYSAYVAIAGLICFEARTRVAVSWSLASLAVGTLGVLVSGSRSGALALACALLIAFVRTPRLRLPIGLVVAVLVVALIAVAAVTGTLGEIVSNRLFDSSGSLGLRTEAWRDSLRDFWASPIVGDGVIAGTIDSSYVYLLKVGGLVGFAVVAGMLWLSLLRPLRRRDFTTLPLLVGAAVSAAFQDTLGQPLANWALGAFAFLLALRVVEDAEEDERRPFGRAVTQR